MLKSIYSKISRLTLRDYLFFAEAWILLLTAKAIIYFLPMKILAKIIGGYMDKPSDMTKQDDENKIAEIKLAVQRADKYSFWQNKCFNKSVALRMMLNMRNIKNTLYLGVSKEDKDKLNAHAWIKIDDEIIIGGNHSKNYSVVAWFGS